MKKDKKELLKKILSKKETRIAYFEHDFYNFFLYYFRKHIKFKKMAKCHNDWCVDAKSGFNIYVEGHRELAKTTILGLGLEVWKIVYGKCDFICNLCYDKNKAKSFNKMIAIELLQNKNLIDDFGVLFSLKKSDFADNDISERGISEFVTTNYIKVKAFGMGEAIRGEVYNHKIKGNVRPDHLNVDDIDNIHNTKNKRIIDADMDFIYNEIFGGLDKNKTQIIWLGNVIRRDGRNPRIKQNFKTNGSWKIYSNFIFGEAGTMMGDIHWERYVRTQEEADEINKNKIKKEEFVISLEKLRKDEKSGFDQNYLGNPIVKGATLFKDEFLNYNVELTQFDYYTIGLDPAFSMKKLTDGFGIVVTGFKKIKDTRYKKAVYCKKLEELDKDTFKAINIIKSLYVKYNARIINIESNNGGETFGRLLINEGLSVNIMFSSKDKVTRFKEYEGEMMRGTIYYDPGVTELIDQLIEFTGEDGGDDDLVDAFINSLKPKHSEFYTS